MRTLILAEGDLNPLCSRIHIPYIFSLPKGGTQLHIDFGYDPKILEDRERSKELIIGSLISYIDTDSERSRLIEEWERFLPLRNLLTVSIDDCQGFRGCAHRHSPKQHLTISQEKASPGFIPGPLTAGQWKATISVHAVVTGKCHYKLHVWEGEKACDGMDFL